VFHAAAPRPSRSVAGRSVAASAGAARRRLAAAVALAAAAALVLSGCGELRTGSAAVVGDQRITDDELQSLVDESLAPAGAREGLASNFRGDVGAYRRSVLLVQVQLAVAEAAAARLGLPVDEAEIEAQFRSVQEQAGGAEAFATRLASQPVSEELYRDIVRADVIKAQIGYQQGKVRRPSESQLRSAYENYLSTATTANLTLIQVPDAATSRRVLSQVRADPAAFGSIGAQFSQDRQPPAARDLPLSGLPPDLVARLQQTEPGSIVEYRLTNGEAQAFYVIRFGGIKRPSFAAARPQLEAQARQQAQAEGEKYLVQVAREVGVDVSPRYGTWNPDHLGIAAFVNPVIKPTPTPAPTGVPGAPPAEPGATPAPSPSS
jgi:peptidyl-prolyl cis-trans isomerase SurA